MLKLHRPVDIVTCASPLCNLAVFIPLSLLAKVPNISLFLLRGPFNQNLPNIRPIASIHFPLEFPSYIHPSNQTPFFCICPPPGLLPVLGPCERYMTLTKVSDMNTLVDSL